MNEFVLPSIVVMPLRCGRCGELGDELLIQERMDKAPVAICSCRCGEHRTELPMQTVLGVKIRPKDECVMISGVPEGFQ